jgi:hypothetical protein
MGATEHAFVVEAGPTGDVEKVKKAFSDKFREDIHIEVLEDKAGWTSTRPRKR